METALYILSTWAAVAGSAAVGLLWRVSVVQARMMQRFEEGARIHDRMDARLARHSERLDKHQIELTRLAPRRS
jgi:hypothetical protein